ncbi:serine hydrolase [Deinococcus radiomollis]|uniref:serine hydrolase domain-containing protein n=1 Tax=Deinococcus radiomollis TaxID=468916 RepID=UPI003891CD7A
MTSSLPNSSPEAQGLPARAVQNFVEAAEREGLELHSFVLLRRGHLIAQGAWAPFTLDQPHALFSVSKSFTSTAVGLAVAEGLMSLDDAVVSFFPEFRPEVVSDRLAAMRVRHLLTMTSGHADDLPLFQQEPQPWAQSFLAQPVDFAPGTHFVYSSAATYMLAATVERLSRQPLLDYLRPRLFGPLGIGEASWEPNFEGVAVGGWGLSLRAQDMACLGELYRQKGVWKDRQGLGQEVLPWRLKDRTILSEDWVEQATSAQVKGDGSSPHDWNQGYGFQFWRCRHGAYRADGALGQFIVVMPEQEAVLAITGAVDSMQSVLDLVWAHLLPAFEPGPLIPEPGALERLHHKCASLELAPVAGLLDSPLAVRFGDRAYTFEANALGLTELRLGSLDGQAELTLTTSEGSFPLVAGLGTWAVNHTRFDHVSTLDPSRDRRVAACAAWTAPDVLEIHLNYLNTAATHVLKLHFLKPHSGQGGETLALESSSQTSMRVLEPLTLEGTPKP